MLVTSRFTNQVLAYGPTGQFLSVFASGGGLVNPVGATFGPDGHLYVASANTNQVLRFDGSTGAPLGVLGTVTAPRNLNVGPDGLLYICSGSTGRVVRYSTSGQFFGVFAQSSLIAGNTSLTFGPDFHLYVGSVTNNQVVRFHGVTGALIGVFANVGLSGTHDLSFGPDGHLYVSNAFSNSIVRFDGATGAPLGVFVSDAALSAPLGLSFGKNGNLFVANQGGDDVREYDALTGALLGAFVTTGSGGLDGPLFATFVYDPNGARIAMPTPGLAGQTSHAEVVGLQPGGVTLLTVGTTAGTIPLPCAGTTLGIADPLVLGIAAADEAGRYVQRFFVPLPLAGFAFRFQAIDFSRCAVSPVLVHSF
jgi:streptogramin lyase